MLLTPRSSYDILSGYQCVILREMGLSKTLRGRDMSGNIYNGLFGNSIVDTGILSSNIKHSVRMLHWILEDDHMQGHPPLTRN